MAATMDSGSLFDVANDSATEEISNESSTSKPPSTAQVGSTLDGVIAEKVSKQQAISDQAMAAMQALGSATPGAPSPVSGKDNNTHKLHETLKLSNDLFVANGEKKRAEDIRAFVDSMLTAVRDLYSQVKRHEKDSKARAVFETQQGEENLEAALKSIRSKVVAAEARDLKNLLAKVAAIKEAQAEVVDLDALVQSGAHEGMAAATQGVYDFTRTLEARQEAVSRKESLEAWPQLQAGEEQARIAEAVQDGEQKASAKLGEHQTKQEGIYQEALAHFSVFSTSTEVSNLTRMNEITQQLSEANILKANSEKLQRAVTKTIQLISAFFEIFDAFKEAVPVRMATASTGAINAQEQTARDVKTAVDKGNLQDISVFFYFYQVIWTRYQEAEAQMPKEDKAYDKLKSETLKLAQDVHEWLNKEMLQYCSSHGDCTAARGKLMAILEDGSRWCDERTIQTCTTLKQGRQPNGKMCKWITPFDAGHQIYAVVTDGSSQGAWDPPGKGEYAHCEKNNPPTSGLKFGGDSKSPGIFY